MACVFYQVRLPKSIQNPVKSSSTCFQFFSNLLHSNLIYSNLNQVWPKIPHGSKKLSCTYKVNQPKSYGEMVGWGPFNPVRHPPFPMSLSIAKIPSLHRWFLWHCLGNPSDAFDGPGVVGIEHLLAVLGVRNLWHHFLRQLKMGGKISKTFRWWMVSHQHMYNMGPPNLHF